MEHKVLPYENQLHIPRSCDGAEPTAVELRFPPTFSGKAQRVLRYYDGCIFLFAWNGKFVITDESLLLDDGDDYNRAPLDWQGNDLGELEAWLEGIADILDDSQIPGWRAFCAKEASRERENAGTTGRVPGDLSEAVMVKMSRSESYMIFSTVDRRHGRSRRFLVTPELLDPLLRNDSGEMADLDGADFAAFSRRDGYIHIAFTWLNMLNGEDVRGFRQSVKAPVELVKRVFYGSEEARYLYVPAASYAGVKVDESGYTQSTIHRVLYEDKRIRRAFSKAMRNCFRWRGNEVTLYGDGRYDFFFRTASGFPKAGGLILHETERQGHHCFCYSVHT